MTAKKLTKFQQLVNEKALIWRERLKTDPNWQELIKKHRKNNIAKSYKFLNDKELAKLSPQELQAYREARQNQLTQNTRLVVQALKQGIIAEQNAQQNAKFDNKAEKW